MAVLALSADERARRARLSGFTGVLVQGVAVTTGIISVPLAVSYLGPERYGIWLTLNSALTWLYLGQMGLGGNALVTRLSRAFAADDETAAAELISTSFFALAGAAALVGLLLGTLASTLDWRIVFNTSSQVPEAELGLAVAVSLALFLTLFPTSVIEAVFVAHHEGYVANAWSLGANLLSFVGLVYAVSVKATLPWLVAGVFGARVLAAVAAGASLFIRRPGLTPKPARFSLRRLRSLGNLGVRYLVAQLTSMGMFQSQPFIVTQIIGPSAVAVFAVTQRLLTLPLMLTQTIANAHVAAYSDAFSTGELPWLRKTLARSTAIAVVAAGGVLLVLGLLARPTIRVWAGPSLVPEPSLVVWLSLYVAVACMVTPASSALYATERVGRQALYGFANACLTVVLGIIFTLRWGLPGLGAAMFVALAVVNPVAQWRELRAAGILSRGTEGLSIANALLRLESALLSMRHRGDRGDFGDVLALENKNPNSGGFSPTAEAVQRAEDVVESVTDGRRRSMGVEGFEGLALDDALAYLNPQKHLTFLPQAKAIARIARTVSETSPSILELGCGGGDMAHFLSLLGIPRYVGIEGNALVFRFSPHVQKRPQQFHCLNLGQEIDLGRTFSVVCSFEVLEHIPEASLDGILGTIRNHMSHHSVFVGTASLQADLDVHVTVEERPFWLAAFRRHGLVPHPNAKSWQADIEAHHAFNWNASNTNVFVLKREF